MVIFAILFAFNVTWSHLESVTQSLVKLLLNNSVKYPHFLSSIMFSVLFRKYRANLYDRDKHTDIGTVRDWDRCPRDRPQRSQKPQTIHRLKTQGEKWIIIQT